MNLKITFLKVTPVLLRLSLIHINNLKPHYFFSITNFYYKIFTCFHINFTPPQKSSVFSASSVKSLSNTVSVSLQLLFLSSFLFFKHLHRPLQFFNQLFLSLQLVILLHPLSTKPFDHLFNLMQG